MAVFVIITDGPTNDIVDIVRRDEQSLMPFGARQFGPSPKGNPFARANDSGELQKILVLQSVRENLDVSPFLSDAKREQLKNVYNSILPGDRLQGVTRETAEQIGLIERSPVATDQPPGVQSNIIVRFVDP